MPAAPYAVTVELTVARNANIIDPDTMTELLAHHGGAVSIGPDNRIGLSFTMLGADVADAGRAANELVSRLLGRLDVDVAEIVRLEVMTEDEQDRILAQPLIPELLGANEVAKLLDVSKQRVSQLRERPDFPDPVVVLASGPVWTKPSLHNFMAHWDRSPGRPPRKHLVAVGEATGVAEASSK